jgi:hypothetical protein
MAVVVKTLIPPKQAENVLTVQYSVSTGRTIIDKFTATNTSGSNAGINVYLTQFGEAAGASNLIVDTRVIVPEETYTFPELVGQVLEAGASILTNASAASALTIRASGREITS